MIRRNLLMCQKHWDMLSGDIQCEVRSAYRAINHDKDSIRRYLLAWVQAQREVAEAEGFLQAIVGMLDRDIAELSGSRKKSEQ